MTQADLDAEIEMQYAILRAKIPSLNGEEDAALFRIAYVMGMESATKKAREIIFEGSK